MCRSAADSHETARLALNARSLAIHALRQGTREVLACEFPRKNFFGLYRYGRGGGVGRGLGRMSGFVYRSNWCNVPFGFVPSQLALSAHTA